MNKLMLASITVLLAGGLALPVEAQDDRRPGGDTAENDRGGNAERADRGDRRGERGEGRGNRGEARGPGPGRGDDNDVRRANAGPPQGTPRQFAPAPGRGPAVQPSRAPVVAQATLRPPVAQGRYDRRDDRRDSRYDRRDDRRDDRYGHRDDRRDNRYDRRDDRRDNRYDRRDDRRDWNNDRRQDYRHYARGNNHRWNGNQWHPQYRYRAPVRYAYPRGYRPYQWRVGYRLPPAYYHRNYYVDYRNYYLPPPPYGYHWVRVDRDVVLVSIASGLIRDILYGLYY